MKVRLIIVTFVVMLGLCSVSVICYAQNFEGDLHIEIPPEWKKESLENKGLIYHGTLESDGLEMGIYSERNIRTNRINNWKNRSVNELEKQAEESINNQDKDGKTQLKDWFVWDNEQMRFLVFNGMVMKNKKIITCFTQYTTIINGGSLQFTFYSDEPLTGKQKEIAKAIVSTAKYDKITEPSIDRKIILELVAIFSAIILLIASVIWNIRRYRKKLKMEGKEDE